MFITANKLHLSFRACSGLFYGHIDVSLSDCCQITAPVVLSMASV